MIQSLPNIITLVRLVAVPVIVWLMLAGEFYVAFWGFVLAGVSDGVDGFIAKRFNARTRLGAYLDPIADKVLLVSIYVVLGMLTYLPTWVVILVVSRDILIVGAVVLSGALGQRVKIRPIWSSKFNTTFQIMLAGIVMAELAVPVLDTIADQVLVYLVAATTLLSGFSYLRSWLRTDAPQVESLAGEMDGDPAELPTRMAMENAKERLDQLGIRRQGHEGSHPHSASGSGEEGK